MAVVGVAVPRAEVPPAGAAARTDRHSTTPGTISMCLGQTPSSGPGSLDHTTWLRRTTVRRATDKPSTTSALAYGDIYHNTMVPVGWRLGHQRPRRRLQHHGVGSTIL
jgi:hypothetical protein